MSSQIQSLRDYSNKQAGIPSLLRRYSLVAGLLMMFLFTWPIDLANSGILPIRIPVFVSLMLGWGFIIASLTMTGITLGSQAMLELLKRFLIWRIDRRWYLVALFLLPGLQLLSILLNFLVNPAIIDFHPPMAYRIFGSSSNLLLLVGPWFLYEVFTNGEEIGWRGYLLPRLQSRYNPLISSLIVGSVWALWHLPKFLGQGPLKGQSLAWFIVAHLALAVIYTWLYNNTKGSLLLVTLFHASGNTASMFLPTSFAAAGGIESNLMIMLYVLAALVVILLTSPWRLSNTANKQIQEISHE